MPLVACPHCSEHIKSNEPRCPHCGRTVRRSDGSIALTAGAIVLGIAAAGACDSEVETAMPAYGVPDVSSQSSSATSSSGGGGDAGQGGAQGGAGGMGGNAGGGGEMAMPAYGVAGFGQ
jgi:hypothetical protein